MSVPSVTHCAQKDVCHLDQIFVFGVASLNGPHRCCARTALFFGPPSVRAHLENVQSVGTPVSPGVSEDQIPIALSQFAADELEVELVEPQFIVPSREGLVIQKGNVNDDTMKGGLAVFHEQVHQVFIRRELGAGDLCPLEFGYQAMAGSQLGDILSQGRFGECGNP